jgi:hypothetical protein
MDDLAPPLAALLGAAHVTDVTRLSGGASRDTFRFVADGRPLILQRQRAGDVRDMGNEALVLRAASAAGVPVPALLASSTDASALGQRVHRGRCSRGRDHRSQDPARCRVRARTRACCRRSSALHWPRCTRSTTTLSVAADRRPGAPVPGRARPDRPAAPHVRAGRSSGWRPPSAVAARGCWCTATSGSAT